MSDDESSRAAAPRRLHAPSSTLALEADQKFSVGALQVGSDVQIAVAALSDTGSTIDDFPDAAYDELVGIAEDSLDWTRLVRETENGRWPHIGSVVLRRDDGEYVTMTVGWDDSYLK